jgi:DNA-binding NtrC family response regulator
MWGLDKAEEVATVVVCSPSEQLLDVMCEWLVEQHFFPLPAATASSASRLCRYARPELLIVDLDLPNDSGLDLLREKTQAVGLVEADLLNRDLDLLNPTPAARRAADLELGL